MRRNRNRSGGNSSKNIVQPQNVLSRQNSWQAGEQTLENQIKQQTDKEVISQYLEAFTVLFGRVNSILAGRQIKCELSNNNALAFTDGNTIFFRFDNLETAFKAYVNRQRNSMVGNTLAQNKLMDRLGQLRGLNYHELAHCLFTPKRTSSLLKMLSEEVKTTTNSSVSAHLPKIFNLLEDARIESLFVAKYPASQYFFTDAVMKYIANNPSTFSFLLMDGRKYLPLELRKAFREALIASQSISEKDLDLLSDLNDTYRSLSLTPSACKKGNEDKIAFEICKKYLAILERNNILEECAKHGDDNVGGHSQHTNTKTDSEVEELHEIRQEQEEEFDSEDSEDSEDSKDSGDSDGSDDSDDSDDSEGSGDSDDDSEDSDDSDDSDSSGGSDDSDDDSDDSDDGSDNSGSLSKENSSAGKSKLSEKDKVFAEVFQSNKVTVQQEMADVLSQISSLVETTKYDKLFSKCGKPSHFAQTPIAYRALATNLARTIGKLKADSDNQWETGSSFGKFNIVRSIESRDLHFDVFDEYLDEGDERPDAEVVILLDQSSSMASRSYIVGSPNLLSPMMNTMGEASASMWAIKYACNQHDIPCSVIGYDDSYQALYSTNTKVGLSQIPIFDCRGGTYPEQVLTIAKTILQKSEAKHRLLFSITDGDWFVDRLGLKAIEDMNKSGALTFLVQLPSSFSWGVSSELNGGTFIEKPNFSLIAQRVLPDGKTTPVNYGHQYLVQSHDCVSLTNAIGKHITGAMMNP
jgi:hypothetical protein